MKKWMVTILALCTICTLTGCGSTESKTEQTTNSVTTTQKSSSSAVVYFTATGNTEAIAQGIADELSAPIYKIEPLNEYTSEDLSYNNDNCRANKEQNDDKARPEIANDLSSVTKADTIYLGYPIWWGTNPRIIQTFLDTYDLTGKTVYTFCTSGSSGVETSVSDLQKLYPKVNIVSGHRFKTNASSNDIANWLTEIK